MSTHRDESAEAIPPVATSLEAASPSRAEDLVVHSLEELGRCIRAERKSQKLAIDAAAGLIGVSPDSFSRLERGIGGVGSDRLLAIMDGLGLELVVRRKRRGAQVIQPKGIPS